MKKINFYDIDISGGFWKEKQDMVKNITAQAVYDRFCETHRFDALSCTWKEGEPDMPHFFWDSDVAKWIEGAAYILEKEDRPELKKIVDRAIDQIVQNSDENGYFNSHYLVTEKDERFCYRNNHELYCAGHLIEAAVAYYHATGDRKFLDAMCKYADYIEKVFKIEKSAKFFTPGHPELELALVRLYETTGEKRYLDLAEYFINIHGTAPDKEQQLWPGVVNELYNMDEIPLKDRSTIDGHAVRALYLYSGAADVARLCGNEELIAACKRIFDNAANKRMYITGGVGSTHIGEAFTVDYHLPSRTAYAETCAAISLAYFASRMQLIETDSKYADCVERIIYNGFLSGPSIDGKSFFYENPLEIDPDFNDVNLSTESKEHYPITQRKEVFECSCCPPNIMRFIPSIADYMYNYDNETLYINQYMTSTACCDGMNIQQATDYPASGKIIIKVNSGHRKVALRIPGWCKSFTLNCDYEMKNGYAVVCADEIVLDLDMPIVKMRANRRVHDCAGRIAIMRGPVVYCAEGIDNGSDIKNLRIDIKGEFNLGGTEFMLPDIHTTGYQLKASDSLYSPAGDDYEEVPVKLIPYYAFANRGTTEMCVWLLEK